MSALPLEPGDPTRLGRFRLLGRLGEGGQGVVYLGESSQGDQVAVKVLKAGADPRARDRLAREMAAAMKVAPFCTARVLDSSVDGPLPYIVSEFVEGQSLQERVRIRGPLSGGDLDRLMISTARALRAIHLVGIVHRDLKPANILLGPDGPRVVDFGIARAIDADHATQMIGTPAYFAPEWLRDEPPTPASDVFAWAGTMVFAATGRPPFGQSTNIPALLHRVANDQPDLEGVPPWLRPLLERCLDKDPARRPTAAEVDEWLLGAQSGGESWRAGGPVQPTRRDVTQPAQDRPAPPDPTPLPEPRPMPVVNGPAAPPRSSPQVPQVTPRNTGSPTPGPVDLSLPPSMPWEPVRVEREKPAGGRGGRIVVSLVLVLAVAALSAIAWRFLIAGTSEPAIPADYAGTWSGTVGETDGFGTQPANVTITMAKGQKQASMTIASGQCTIVLHEVISGDFSFTVSQGQCQADTVQLGRQDSDSLDFHASGPSSYSANGTLSRVGK